MPKPPRRRRRRLLLPLLAAAVLAGGFLYWDNTSLQTARFDPAFTDLPAGFERVPPRGPQRPARRRIRRGQRRPLCRRGGGGAGLHLLSGGPAGQVPGPRARLSGDGGRRAHRHRPHLLCHRQPRVGHRRGAGAEGDAVRPRRHGALQPIRDAGARRGHRGCWRAIDDPNGYADQKTPEELAAEVYATCGDPFWLLLAHRNDRFVSQYSLLGADLVLSGHGHGGVIRLPFTDGLLSTERTLFPSYTAGLYVENSSCLFVTRGLGNSGPSFRLFQPAGGGGSDAAPGPILNVFRGFPMTEFHAGQFDIAVIGAGHRGTRRTPGRALRVQAFLRSKNLGGGGIQFRRALRSSTGTRVARGNKMGRNR